MRGTSDARFICRKPGQCAGAAMLEDMAMRGLRSDTQHEYIRFVRSFAAFLGQCPTRQRRRISAGSRFDVGADGREGVAALLVGGQRQRGGDLGDQPAQLGHHPGELGGGVAEGLEQRRRTHPPGRRPR